jgi:hypothetical protein
MLVAVLCVGFGAVTAAADDTYTYYFLAPDSYIKAEANDGNTNVNSSVGAYWWQPEDQASPAWPGVEMTAAPEVGENVYKIEGVPAATGTIIFNAFIDAGNPQDPELAKIAHQTININTEGYEAGEAEYDATVETENFNGWIYVLANDEEHTTVNDFSGATTIGGNWFTLDNYKNYETFYGSYGFAADTTETDSETTTDSEPASTEGKKYHAGDTVTVTVEAGDIKIDGAAAKLGAYNYDVNYDASVVKYVSGVDKTTGGMPLVNTAKEGVVKLATMAAMGLAEDFSGAKAPVYELTFEVTADTDDLGINGKCTSLTAVTADGSSTSTLVGVNNPDDPYTDLVIEVECPHQTESDTDSEPDTDTTEPSKVESKTESKTDSKTDSKTESKKDASSKTESKKATGDNASSKSTSSGKSATTSTATSTATVQTAGTFAVVSLVVILMAAAAVVLYTRKKTEE